ncbi:MAG: serine/threonine-protein phosphatase [Nitrospira sp.]|nr:serine/threonine-protein phosphatase [Nitrospira sp.]MBH0182150.1 serine/threonine-protein phosphatase [Nitrospira sp.]MBH0184311.1 serine/threonine-protein phosphatase [Nitrospira sp.]
MSTWVGIGRSEIGLVRTMNQDAFATLDPLGLWAVADGMGGHVGGEIAAQTAIASITAQAQLSADTLRQGQTAPPAFLTDVITQAHHAILGRVKLEPTLRGMGTTIVLLYIEETTESLMAHLAHLGDSRAYRFRSGTLTPLTRDHTLIEKYLARGILTPKTARTHPERHVLTRALGISTPVKPSISSCPLEPQDLLLLCSDGLTKMMEDDDIQDIFTAGKGDPIRTCDRLINESLDRGGIDNVTVVVIAHT